MSKVDSSRYNFPVGVRPIYFPIKDKMEPVHILDKPRYAVIREDTNVVLDIVSNIWSGVNHADVVEVVKKDIIPQLHWDVIDEKLYMWMNGAIMFYSMRTKTSFDIGNTKLYATINAVNSHNRYTRAGIHITLMDENSVTYLPTYGTKSVYTYESMLHTASSLDLVRFQRIVDSIPVVVNNTIEDWKAWDTERIDINRLRILAQLFNYTLGVELVNTFPSGCTRFAMYKKICNHMMNNDKMASSGFNALTLMSKFVRIMKRNSLFTLPFDQLKAEIKSIQIFDWNEKKKSVEETNVADIGVENVDMVEIKDQANKTVEDLLKNIL